MKSLFRPDPNKKAFDIVKARYKSGAGNPITALNGYAKKTPDPVNRWLVSIADETWKVVLGSARRHINSEWKNQVVSVYTQALAGRYPLKKSSNDELALFDFSEFFKPKGTMDTFFLGYVKPFY